MMHASSRVERDVGDAVVQKWVDGRGVVRKEPLEAFSDEEA